MWENNLCTCYIEIKYFPTGLLLYFCYGIWHSHERNQPEVYDQMINYTGDAELTTSMQRLEEDIREQQPKRNTEEAYVQDSYGSM